MTPARGERGRHRRVGEVPRLLRILVVDDDPELGELLSDMLESLGHEVQVAKDGREAMERVRVALPDFILFDLQMPFGGGEDLWQRLRDLNVPDSKLALMSGATDGAARAARMGVRFLRKPFELGDLVEYLPL